MSKSRTTSIRGDADVARAVAMTVSVARAVGLDERRTSAVSTAASEVTRNIVKYAGYGQFTVAAVDDEWGRGVRIVARDRGPGIANVDEALRDHYSTGGTLGLGLPGVRRLMDELVVDSSPGRGTTVTATIRAEGRGTRGRRTRDLRLPRSPFARTAELPAGPEEHPTVVGAGRTRPHRRERMSGDAIVLRWVGDLALVGLVDALGHGPTAASIASQAVAALEEAEPVDAIAALAAIDAGLRQTDGAAGAVVLVDPRSCSFRAAAVGNVRVRVVGANDLRHQWVEGTLGAQHRAPMEWTGSMKGATLLLYSDGISDRFTIGDYPRLDRDEPGVVARTILDRFGKDHDDASCAVARCRP